MVPVLKISIREMNARFVVEVLFKQQAGSPNGFALINAGKFGGLHIRIELIARRSTALIVRDAGSHSPHMETATGSIVPMSAILKLDSKEKEEVTRNQLRSEIMYQASIAPFKSLLRNGVLTFDEYVKIDTILTQKYVPIFVEFMPQNQVEDIP